MKLACALFLGMCLQVMGEQENLKRVANLPRVKRVVGGTDIEKGEWPHLCHMRGKIPSKSWWGIPVAYKNYYCGCAIVDTQWVLTAAHCFTVPGAPDKIKTPKHWHIKLGEIDRNHDVLDKFKHYAGTLFGRSDWLLWYLHATKIILHEDYNPDDTWKNDIALVKLEKKVPIGTDEDIDKIEMADEISWLSDGYECFMKGWGCDTNGGPLTDIAQAVKLPYRDPSSCNVFGPISDTRVCAGYTNQHAGICRGDSGGPLVCARGGQWYQVGIASYTSASNPESVPGVFTKLSHYKSWVQDKIANN